MFNQNIKSPVNIPVEKIHPFEGNPYKVLDNDEMNTLIGSIQEQGILTPIVVRPLENTKDEYELISGHRRMRASQKAGLETVPAFIYAVSRDEAAIMLVDSNLHREHIRLKTSLLRNIHHRQLFSLPVFSCKALQRS